MSDRRALPVIWPGFLSAPRLSSEWRLSPKCATIENGQKGTPKAIPRWEKARPTLSTVGTGSGAEPAQWPLTYGRNRRLLDLERRVLECLVAALVSEWNNLPTDVQRKLFEHATSGKSHDAALLKTRIARFLHDHKDASDSR